MGIAGFMSSGSRLLECRGGSASAAQPALSGLRILGSEGSAAENLAYQGQNPKP